MAGRAKKELICYKKDIWLKNRPLLPHPLQSKHEDY